MRELYLHNKLQCFSVSCIYLHYFVPFCHFYLIFFHIYQIFSIHLIVLGRICRCSCSNSMDISCSAKINSNTALQLQRSTSDPYRFQVLFTFLFPFLVAQILRVTLFYVFHYLLILSFYEFCAQFWHALPFRGNFPLVHMILLLLPFQFLHARGAQS